MKPSGNRPPAAEFLPAALLLAFAVWAAHFWHFRQFGIYEDDWGFVAVPMFWNWQDALRTFWLYLTTWPQGRPVSFVASAFLAFAGTHLGGLPGAYFAGFLLNAGTTVLFYAALRRCFQAPAAFCGALAVTLFPAYSAATLLTNTFMPGVSLFFMVLTIWFYLRNRRLATYLASAFTILSYESCFLPLFALPLLEATSWPRLRREMLRHCSILAAIAAVAFSVRGSIGEPKVATFTSHFSDSLSRVVQAIYLGPRTALYSWLQTPLRLWNERTPEVERFVLIMIPILALALWYLATRPAAEPPAASGWQDPRVRFAAGGLVMLICAYGLAITPPYYPPVHLAGRITGLHIAASAGCGCLAASIAAFLFSLARRPLPRMALTAALAAYLAVLAGFQHRVQLDYITAWKYQREFWKQVVRLCPDLDEGTLIIHDSFPLVEHVLANSWADATILDRLFTFPATWKNAPRLFSLQPTWRDDVQVEGDHLTWANPGGLWAPHRDILHPGNVIVLTGPAFRIELTRLTGTIRLRGRDFPLKPPGPPTLSQYPPGPLHAIVLGH